MFVAKFLPTEVATYRLLGRRIALDCAACMTCITPEDASPGKSKQLVVKVLQTTES